MMPAREPMKPAVFTTTQPKVVDPRYQLEILVPGSYFHTANGIGVTSQDVLYAVGVLCQTTREISIVNGQPRITEFVGPPEGEADDIAFGLEGNPYWTSIFAGEVRCKLGSEIKVVILQIRALAFKGGLD